MINVQEGSLVPIVPTSAVTGEGLCDLLAMLI